MALYAWFNSTRSGILEAEREARELRQAYGPDAEQRLNEALASAGADREKRAHLRQLRRCLRALAWEQSSSEGRGAAPSGDKPAG